jgi:hypothetical protein
MVLHLRGGPRLIRDSAGRRVHDQALPSGTIQTLRMFFDVLHIFRAAILLHKP